MAITKEQKKEILKKVSTIADKNSIVFVNFKSLGGNQTVEMRKKLGESQVSYFVAKKTLVKRALNESKIKGELPSLDGELALVYGDDLIAPAREIYNFQKQFLGSINILGGVFENRFMTKGEMEEIALIPSQDTLRGMFVNVINSPISGLVVSLQAIADQKEA